MTSGGKHRDLFEVDGVKANVKERALHGGIWSITGQVGSHIINLIATMVLARLLTPGDYGLIAMVAVVTGFAMLFKDMGLSVATVQKDVVSHEQVSVLFWINLTVSIGIGLVLAAIAPLVSWFYQESRLTWITVALAATFPIGGLAIQHGALLRRQMRFRVLCIQQLSVAAIGKGVGVACGYMGLGYWSLVYMQIGSSILAVIAIWLVCPWRPGWPRLRVGAKSMVKFGANIAGFNILNYFSRNTDNLLIGRFLGTPALGVYNKAYELLMLPLRQISYPISNVAVPALSRLQNDPEGYRRFYYKTVKTIAYIAMPLIACMAALSEDIILIVLGGQWQSASPIFRILAFAAFLQPVAATTGAVMISAGLADRMLKWGVLSSVVTVTSFVIGLPYGVTGVALAYSFSCYTLFIPCLVYAYKKTAVDVRSVLKIMSIPCIVSILIYVFIELVLQRLDKGPLLNMALALGVVVMTVLAAFCFWRQFRLDAISIYRLIPSTRKA